jgi:hypothetical protein
MTHSTAFLVVREDGDGCTFSCETAIKVWLDKEKAEAHAVSLNLDAYREHWISEEQRRRMNAAEERLPRVSPKDRLAVRIAALEACREEVPLAFDKLGMTEAPDDFDGPFSVTTIDIE